MNKRIISYAIVPLLGVALIGGASVTLAASPSVDHSKPMDAIVSAISAKFNLNSTEVQSVVDQAMKAQRTEMEAKQEQNFADRLAKAVADKKLTQAQADLIKAKLAELKASRDSLEGKTPEERLSAMKEQMASLKKWATDNNIPQGYMMFGGPEMGKGHKDFSGHRPHGFGMKKHASPETTK